MDFLAVGTAGGVPGNGGAREKEVVMGMLLWIAAVVLVIVGIVTLIQGSVLLGVVLIVVGLLVGPGGVSIFNSRGRAT
jgi:hypothetical protein